MKTLTKKEKRHLRVVAGVRSLAEFRATAAEQAQMRRVEPRVEPCFACKAIARKLGLVRYVGMMRTEDAMTDGYGMPDQTDADRIEELRNRAGGMRLEASQRDTGPRATMTATTAAYLRTLADMDEREADELEALERGDLNAVREHVRAAAYLEREWGDAPAWGPVERLLNGTRNT